MTTTACADLVEGDLEPLGAFLTSGRAGPGCKSLPEVDGLLTAVAIGPKPVPAGEWLPLVWGGHRPVLKDPDEARRWEGAMLGRQAQVLRQLREKPGAYRPLFAVADEDAAAATEWARGFIAGFELRRAAWQPLRGSRAGWSGFVLIVAQLPDWDAEIEASHGGAELASFRRGARELLPGGVAEIHRFWRERRSAGDQSAGGPLRRERWPRWRDSWRR